MKKALPVRIRPSITRRKALRPRRWCSGSKGISIFPPNGAAPHMDAQPGNLRANQQRRKLLRAAGIELVPHRLQELGLAHLEARTACARVRAAAISLPADFMPASTALRMPDVSPGPNCRGASDRAGPRWSVRVSSLQFRWSCLISGAPPRVAVTRRRTGRPAVALATVDGSQKRPHLPERVAQDVGVAVSVVDEALEKASPNPIRSVPPSRSSAGVTCRIKKSAFTSNTASARRIASSSGRSATQSRGRRTATASANHHIIAALAEQAPASRPRRRDAAAKGRIARTKAGSSPTLSGVMLQGLAADDRRTRVRAAAPRASDLVMALTQAGRCGRTGRAPRRRVWCESASSEPSSSNLL